MIEPAGHKNREANARGKQANAGEADLLFRGLNMEDIPILREGERAKGYRTHLWPTARGSELALYPNLTARESIALFAGYYPAPRPVDSRLSSLRAARELGVALPDWRLGARAVLRQILAV